MVSSAAAAGVDVFQKRNRTQYISGREEVKLILLFNVAMLRWWQTGPALNRRRAHNRNCTDDNTSARAIWTSISLCKRNKLSKCSNSPSVYLSDAKLGFRDRIFAHFRSNSSAGDWILIYIIHYIIKRFSYYRGNSDETVYPPSNYVNASHIV